MSVEQAAQGLLALDLVEALREVRRNQSHIGEILSLADLQEGGLAPLDVDWFFPENDRHIVREAAHKMLRPLENEVPPQVRKA